MKRTLFLIGISLVGLFSCKRQNQDNMVIGEKSTQSIKQVIRKNNLPVLLLQLPRGDRASAQLYEEQLNVVSGSVARELQTNPDKIVINSYLMPGPLGGGFVNYTYSDKKLQLSSFVPAHIQDSFRGTFVCYSPDYWRKLPKATCTVTIPFDTLQRRLIIEVKQLE